MGVGLVISQRPNPPTHMMGCLQIATRTLQSMSWMVGIHMRRTLSRATPCPLCGSKNPNLVATRRRGRFFGPKSPQASLATECQREGGSRVLEEFGKRITGVLKLL